MTKKPRWNLWRIKSRWLRAVVAALIVTPVLFTVVTIVAFILLVIGAAEGAGCALSTFWREQEVKKIGRNWWRAVTLGEAA